MSAWLLCTTTIKWQEADCTMQILGIKSGRPLWHYKLIETFSQEFVGAFWSPLRFWQTKCTSWVYSGSDASTPCVWRVEFFCLFCSLEFTLHFPAQCLLNPIGAGFSLWFYAPHVCWHDSFRRSLIDKATLSNGCSRTAFRHVIEQSRPHYTVVIIIIVIITINNTILYIHTHTSTYYVYTHIHVCVCVFVEIIPAQTMSTSSFLSGLVWAEQFTIDFGLHWMMGSHISCGCSERLKIPVRSSENERAALICFDDYGPWCIATYSFFSCVSSLDFQHTHKQKKHSI